MFKRYHKQSRLLAHPILLQFSLEESLNKLILEESLNKLISNFSEESLNELIGNSGVFLAIIDNGSCWPTT